MTLVIDISVASQRLTVLDDQSQEIVFGSQVATAKNGTGQMSGSECTPLGEHRIRAKIGAGEAINTVFVGRRLTGEIYTSKLGVDYPKRDWILTRIMWLCGEQFGHNRLGSVDTQRRYIYIHGAPDSHAMGIPSSHGCIKMRNTDVIALFDLVDVGTKVFIRAD
jgi:lipoprotein-anchoring transpeptidase ErfK/SrfK